VNKILKETSDLMDYDLADALVEIDNKKMMLEGRKGKTNGRKEWVLKNCQKDILSYLMMVFRLQNLSWKVSGEPGRVDVVKRIGPKEQVVVGDTRITYMI
jgi:hypothetical protein